MSARGVGSGRLRAEGRGVVKTSKGKSKKEEAAALELPAGVRLRRELRVPGGGGAAYSLCFSPDGLYLASGWGGGRIHLWEWASGERRGELTGHEQTVYSVAYAPDGDTLASGGVDGTVRLWNTSSGELTKRLVGHSQSVWDVAFSPDGRTLASGSLDKTVRLWDVETGADNREIGHHESTVFGVVFSSDGRMLASVSDRTAVSVWDLESGECTARFDSSSVSEHLYSLSWSSDDRTLVTGSTDKTVCIWDSRAVEPPRVLEGHIEGVSTVRLSLDGQFLASSATDKTVKLWAPGSGVELGTIPASSTDMRSNTLAFHPHEPILATFGRDSSTIAIYDLDVDVLLGKVATSRSREYTNAKVVLLGESGVGKTGLGRVLVGKEFEATESTHGRHVWRLSTDEVDVDDQRTQTREVLLWDMAGQPGYRVFHRQHLDEVAVGLVLFDSRSETDPFAGVGYWARALDEARREFPLHKVLVAARTDRGGPAVSGERIDEEMERWGFAGFLETSARRGVGIDDLRRLIREAIAWNRLPVVTAPVLFARLKVFLVDEKAAGRVLARREGLAARFLESLGEEGGDEDIAEEVPGEVSEEVMETCLGRIEAAGLIRRMSFGGLVLLQPELLDAYGAWLAQAARTEPDGLGSIAEKQAKDGEFPMDDDRPLAGREDEELLLLATVQDVLSRGIALRQPTEAGDMLVFPSELRTDMPEYPGGYVQAVRFRFEGPVRAVYATLAVCLTHARAFERERFYRNAALFRAAGDHTCGFAMDYPDRSNDALGRLTVFFDPGTPRGTKLTFLRYVNQQLEQHAFEGSLERERIYQCACGNEIQPEAVAYRIAQGEKTAVCPFCVKHTPIDDLAEQSARMDRKVARQLAQSADERERQARVTVLDQRELGAEFHVFLSHNSKDRAAVQELAEALRDQGILPWVDTEQMLAGERFAPALEEVLDTVEAVAVVVGPNGIGRWHEMEYGVALQAAVEDREIGRSLRLIPVLLPGAPGRLPAFLRGFGRVDLRKGVEDLDSLIDLVHAILGKRGTPGP